MFLVIILRMLQTCVTVPSVRRVLGKTDRAYVCISVRGIHTRSLPASVPVVSTLYLFIHVSSTSHVFGTLIL